MWGKILTGVALAGSVYVYSCANDPKREEERRAYRLEIQNIHTRAREEAQAILAMSCPTSIPNKYVQLKPLIPGDIVEGTEMRALYIDKLEQPSYKGGSYKDPVYYEIDPNQLTLTQQYKDGKNMRTRDVGSMPVLPPTIRFNEAYRKCITAWQG